VGGRIGVIPVLGPDDDGFHEPSDHWWETETAWFSFNVPERRMGGWLYTQVLAVQGVCKGGAWVWDDTGILYEVDHRGLPLPEGTDLRDCTLPNGNSVRVLEPLLRYHARYADGDRLTADLVFAGTMAPHSHPLGVAPFGTRGRHFDQPGHVTGEIVLGGETIAIDCFAGRDRSWGPRPMGPDPRRTAAADGDRPPRPRRAETGIGYGFASASSTDSFLAYTVPHEDGTDDLSAGYLYADGTYARLVSGCRTVAYDAATRWITDVHLEALDELGRPLVADGQLVARHERGGPSGTGLFLWRWNGVEGWGEDQSYASDAVWAAVGAPP
jgi:hypothetical protein